MIGLAALIHLFVRLPDSSSSSSSPSSSPSSSSSSPSSWSPSPTASCPGSSPTAGCFGSQRLSVDAAGRSWLPQSMSCTFLCCPKVVDDAVELLRWTRSPVESSPMSSHPSPAVAGRAGGAAVTADEADDREPSTIRRSCASHRRRHKRAATPKSRASSNRPSSRSLGNSAGRESGCCDDRI